MTKEFDERNAAKSRAKCAEMADAASTGKRVLTERERQILDMWPKFEDGEYVMPGDKWLYLGNPAKENTVSNVTFSGCGATLCSDIREQHIAYGKRIKRPVQSVLDADGVEINVGDTVWHCNGIASGVVTSIDVGSLMHTTRYVDESGTEFRDAARNLTHTRPDSWERLEEDAGKGVCEYAGAMLCGDIDAHDCETCRFYKEHGGMQCEQQRSIDIVRRAKALAGIEEDE